MSRRVFTPRLHRNGSFGKEKVLEGPLQSPVPFPFRSCAACRGDGVRASMELLQGIPKSYVARAVDELRAGNRRLRKSLTAAEVAARCPKAIEHLWWLDLCIPQKTPDQEVSQSAREGASLLRARSSRLRWRTDSEILRAFGARYVQSLSESPAVADGLLSAPASSQASESRRSAPSTPKAAAKKNTRTPRRSAAPGQRAAPPARLSSRVAAAPSETKLRSRGLGTEASSSRTDHGPP